MKKLSTLIMVAAFMLLCASGVFAQEAPAILAALDADGVTAQTLDNAELDALKGTAWYTNAASPTYVSGLRYINMKFNGSMWGSRFDYKQWSMVMKWDYSDRYAEIAKDGKKLRLHGDIYRANEQGNAILEKHYVVMTENPDGTLVPKAGTNTIYTGSKTWNRPLSYKFRWIQSGINVPY